MGKTTRKKAYIAAVELYKALDRGVESETGWDMFEVKLASLEQMRGLRNELKALLAIARVDIEATVRTYDL